jgi:hypothetical protein
MDITKRIERGQLRALKALSRSPVVIRQILAMGEDLKNGVRSIKEIVVFDKEEITEEILQNRVKDITRRIGELQKHPARWPDGYRPSRQKRKHVNTAAADAGWAAAHDARSC